MGTEIQGAKYKFVDSDLLGGMTYWYILTDVDSDGVEVKHGPIHGTPTGDGNGNDDEYLDCIFNAVIQFTEEIESCDRTLCIVRSIISMIQNALDCEELQ